MNQAQQTALEEAVGRPLTALEVTALSPLVDMRNDAAIATVLSEGRTKPIEKMISERGVRAALSIAAGSQFIRLLKDVADAPGAVPEWLTPVLTALGLPVESHVDYADAVGSAYGWLRQDSGLDLGAKATRDMLDLIAASNPAKFGATVAILKGLATVEDPVPFDLISKKLNIAEGRVTL